MYRQTQALRESLGVSDSQTAALNKEVEQLRKALADSHVAADVAQQQVWAGGCQQGCMNCGSYGAQDKQTQFISVCSGRKSTLPGLVVVLHLHMHVR